MTKERSRLEKLLSVLQGASWALAIAGSFYLFVLFLPFGYMIATIIATICFLFSLLCVFIFEIAHIQIEKLSELKKQTMYLERLAGMNSSEL